MYGKVATFLNHIFSFLLYFLSHLVPKSPKVWVFNGWHRGKSGETFCDNPKYLFLHVSNNIRLYNVIPIWIGEDKAICKQLNEHGYKAYPIHSLKGWFFSIYAGYTFIGAHMRLRNWSLSGGSRVIQLWHGDGFKNMRIKNLKDWSWDKLPLLLSQPMLFRRYYFYISSSSYTSRTFIEPSFYANSSEVKSLGLPRYDVLYEEVKGQNIDIHRELKEKVASVRNSGARKLILYAPTFRRGEDPDFPLTPVNLEVINNFLKERHFFLFVSLHPKFAIDQSLTSLTNIISIPSDFDKYPLFHEFDAVITDYSSTCIEFLLISKPTIFYSYDLEKYLENPGVHKEIWNDFPGPRVKSLDELLSCLDKIDLIWTDNHEIMKKTIYPPQDANSSKRIVEEIIRLDSRLHKI